MYEPCYGFRVDIYILPTTLQNVGSGRQMASALANGRQIRVTRQLPDQKWSLA